MTRRRCTSCGQFAVASHVCLKDIDRELQSDEPPGILYKIPDISISVSPVARSETLNCLSTLGLTDFLVSPDVAIANDSIICTLRPVRVTAILDDGNCLFSSLAVALGLSQDCSSILRNIIVSNMMFINFPPNSLQTTIYSADFPNQYRVLLCTSIQEYLSLSKMEENGVFGTCVEIYAFCQIFQMDVYLYHVPLKSWLVYDFSLSTNRRGIFIQQTWNANHFEVISELVSVANEENVAGLQRISCLGSDAMHFSSLILGEDDEFFKYPENTTGVPPAKKAKHTADPSTSKIRLETHVTPTPSQNFCNAKSDQNFPMLSLSENGNKPVLDKEIPKIKDLYTNTATVSHSDMTIEYTTDGNSKSADGKFCGKCLRQSTLQYPLKHTKKEKSDFKNRMFGNRIKDAFPILCNQCRLYCTSDRIEWSHAWPSVFFTLLSDENMPKEQ